MAMDWHDTLMGSVLVISAGLTFAYTRAASRILLILTLTGRRRHIRHRRAAVLSPCLSRCIEHHPPSEAAGSKARIIGEPRHGQVSHVSESTR